MSNVLPIPAVATPAESPTHRTIRVASRGFVVLFGVLFVVFALLTALEVWTVLFYRGHLVTLGPHGGLISRDPPPAGYIAFAAMPLAQKLAYALAAIARTLPTVFMMWSLRALFGLYAKGVVFARENGRHIQWIGVWLIADAIAPFVCHLFLSATHTEIDKAWMHMSSLQELVLGALVFVIAQVMQAGREIEEERDQFV